MDFFLRFQNLKNDILNLFFRPFFLVKKVFFYNILENYNDNPYAISKFLYGLHPEIKQYWVYSEKEYVHDYPGYVILIKKNSIAYWFHKNTAKVLVDNSVGFQTTNSRMKSLFLRKKHQSNYSTWHGTPLKMIGADNKLSNIDYFSFHTSSTHMILGSEYEKQIFTRAYNSVLNILLLGNPRNDCLISNNDNEKKAIQERYCTENKKIVLFAPTYRDVLYDDKIERISDDSIENILNMFSQRFGGEWVFAYRFHHYDTYRKLCISLHQKNVIDVCDYPDMNMLLTSCDALITDYSGSLFDFMLTRRPCFLFMPDYNQYGEDRGMYLSADELPWPHSCTIKDLLENIKTYEEEEVECKVNAFLKKTGNTNSGEATDRLCEMIINDLS